MKQEFIDLAKYRLEKAKNTLSYAKSYIDDTTLDSTVNHIFGRTWCYAGCNC